MLIPTYALPGTPYPMGATWTGSGVNFALYSAHATLVQLCFFDEEEREINRINVRWNTQGVWHCFCPQARPGVRYAYRLHGNFCPEEGHYFNPRKLLLDPYAKDVTAPFQYHQSFATFKNGDTRDESDSSGYMPKAVVVDPAFPEPDTARPHHAWQDSVIYEMHVKGFSRLNPHVPQHLQGTYAGLAHPNSIAYLKNLGITAVELLPVHLSLSEPRLSESGLSNYWGYNSIGFFAPDPRYAATTDHVREFQQMVLALHRAGIEVVLDVVYNHTAEQGTGGPTLCFRGIDNYTYYRTDSQNRRQCLNFTGCGNSLDTRQPKVLQLVTDSLRYWVEHMHIDGFRFDLASTLARVGDDHHYDPHASLLDAMAQDPLLNTVKLIAEPWDCGPNGYQLGNFPQGWSEWNAEWRDTVRRYWRGDDHLLGKMACKLSGSSDTYYSRSPLASINFVTAHDGFTLSDLVTYECKRNQANGEDNRDGNNNNLNWNCGHEGLTSDEHIIDLRWRQQRNMLLTLLLSQGVPMLLSGDEYGRTQQGNNNAYCQDNNISYFNWNWNAQSQKHCDFVRRLIRFRLEHPAFRRTTFFKGQIQYTGNKDVVWIDENGQEKNNSSWESDSCLGMYIAGDYLEGTVDQRGLPMQDESFLLIFNNCDHSRDFTLPNMRNWAEWRIVLDTTIPEREATLARTKIAIPPYSALVLQEFPRSS